MGEMRSTMYTAIAERDGSVVHFWLKDLANVVVAEGSGDTLWAAQQDALEHAAHESARLFLTQVKYPDSLAD